MDAPRNIDSGGRRSLPVGMRIDSWRASDGWALRRFDWPVPAGGAARGSLLFQSGRGDFIEKYLQAIGHWHDRGWAVTGFDWRGQGGSGRFLADPAVGHAESFDGWVEDLDGFVAAWLAGTPGPHVLVGHSMGGHLLLRLLAERHPQVDAAVLLAPMLGYVAGPLPAWAVRWIAGAACRLGLAGRAAWTERLGDGDGPSHRQRNLTHDLAQYADELWWRDRHPELALGAPSWGWLRAGAESMAALAAPGMLEGVATPTLILATPTDRLVDARAIARAAARMPDTELRWFPAAAHELLRERDDIRRAALGMIDAFLAEHAR